MREKHTLAFPIFLQAILLWFLPFSTIFLKKQAEIIHSTKGSIKIKTDKKTSDGKLIPKNLIYFLKYFIVFLFPSYLLHHYSPQIIISVVLYYWQIGK